MASERYRDPEEALEDRVKDLLGRMTLEDKLAQLVGLTSSDLAGEDAAGFGQQVNADPGIDNAAALLADGVGFINLEDTARRQSPAAIAAFVNKVQQHLEHKTRLGIPALFHANIDLGVPALGAVVAPAGLGLAATFAPATVRALAQDLRDQLRALGVLMATSPTLDIGRDPRWQHIEDSAGEDPYLAGRLAVAFVRGLQGEALRDGVAATGKHFVGYGLAVGGIDHAPVHLGRRQLREVFAEPFAAAIRDADLACVMTAPNSIDGLPASASNVLLTELLRADLGFDGLVVSSPNALELLVSHHGVAAEPGDAAIRALAAGLDVELPVSQAFAAPLRQRMEAEALDIKVINRAVRRVLRLKMRLGLFEGAAVDAAAATTSFARQSHRDLARQVAASSMVLLKNSANLLPLDTPGPTGALHNSDVSGERGPAIAVIGPAAEQTDSQSDQSAWISPLAGITARAGEFARVRYAMGCSGSATDADMVDAAVALARDSDTVVLVLGGDSIPDETQAQNLELPAAQLGLLAALEQSGVPIVCVIAGARTYALETVVACVDALVLMWAPGEQGGAALADLLFGDTAFSGRLPLTLVRHVGQVPAYYNRKAGGRVKESAQPLFPFGFGLSYSEFVYSELQCPESVDTHGVLRVAFELANTSARDAEEVVQIYARDQVALLARPLQQLVGFNRVTVPAGETLTCQFRIDLSQFAYFDEAMNFAVEPGDIELMIGASSEDIRLRQLVRLTGELRILSQRQVVATQATAP